MQRSLLNFFSRSSKPLQEISNDKNKISVTESNVAEKEKCQMAPKPTFESGNRSYVPNDSDEDVPIPTSLQKAKRRRLIEDSSDDEENIISVEVAKKPASKSLNNFACSSQIPKNSTVSEENNRSIRENSIVEDASLLNDSVIDDSSSTWQHLTLRFLDPNHKKDLHGRKCTHPEYDSTTLYVPEDFRSKQSPGMRQWWEMKSRHADTILFFKVGKFYEMYHMDATVGVEELGLVYMKGAFAHCGFPEVAFPRMASRLVQKGYKVARVEQTETPDGMAERTKGRPACDKVVRREICQVLTAGTHTPCDRTDISSEKAFVTSDINDATPKDFSDVMRGDSLLLALSETAITTDGGRSFGMTLLNAATGEIKIGQFEDDRHCSRLRTLLAHYPPNQLLVERGAIGPGLKSVLKGCLSSVPTESLLPVQQFWTSKFTVEEIESSEYFTGNETSTRVDDHSRKCSLAGKECWPDVLLQTLSEDDPLGRTVKPEWNLAIRCLGAVIYYLRYCLIDREILSLGLIQPYIPPDCQETDFNSNSRPFYNIQSSMVLDSITLANIDLLRNNVDGTMEGTLIERLDFCSTSFGRRLLRQWLTAPLCDPVLIRQRQSAIGNLIELMDNLSGIREDLRKLPDLERLITKIHLLGVKGADRNHPDSRAVIFEEIQYSRKNIIDFVATINGFDLGCRILENLAHLEVHSDNLRKIIFAENNGENYRDLLDIIKYFRNAFDAEKAKQDGRITPEQGIDPDYDASVRDIQRIHQELEEYRMDYSKKWCTRLTYWGTGRNRYQIELSDSDASKVPRTWQLSSQRKGFKRYRSQETQEWLAELTLAEERKDASLRSIMRLIFVSFSKSFRQWHSCMRSLAELDCLISLAIYSANAGSVTCVPEFMDLSNPNQKPFLEIKDGLHPCLMNTFSKGDIIANDVYLGQCQDPEPTLNKVTVIQSPGSESFSTGAIVLLVTGPNMGGKSTLMRQTALLVILAHLGCRIPAMSCRLTPVDRIFSRLGASDRLMSGESTFLVELSETSAILRHCTPNSLVLMDELGRGTSTHDGAALAGAVLAYLAQPNRFGGRSGPRTLFSTHYHSLVDQVAQLKSHSLPHSPDNIGLIGLGHMACMVDEQSDAESGLEDITFLYKFIPGSCPKSYGFNAARLAHLPDEVTRLGLLKAKEFERTSTTFACLRKLLSGKLCKLDVQLWHEKLKTCFQ